MAAWRVTALLSVPAALGLAVACSSFESSDDDARDDGGAAPDDSGATDGSTDATPAAASRVYVFGGYSDNAGRVTAEEAWAAEIGQGGALGEWTRVPQLDTSRYFGATAVTSSGRIVFAGGNRTVADASEMNDPHTPSVDVAALAPLAKFVSSTPLGRRVSGAQAAVSGQWVIVAGGQDDLEVPSSQMQVASFDTNGGLSSWEPAGDLPLGLTHHGFIALGDTVYLAGGQRAADGSYVAIAEVWRATVGAKGVVDPLTAATPMPEARSEHRLVTVGNRIYAIGGRFVTGAPTETVVIATPNADGNITWGAAASLPAQAALPCAVVAKDTIYVIGGFSSNSSTPHGNVYIGSVGAAGAIAWSEGKPLPGPRAGHGCAAF
jgi:hypothetical protein